MSSSFDDKFPDGKQFAMSTVSPHKLVAVDTSLRYIEDTRDYSVLALKTIN